MDMRVASAEMTEAAARPETKARRAFSWKLVFFAAPALALAALAWWLLRGPTTSAVPVSRGAAAEIVDATGAVEPETWSRSTPLVRGRIVERCRCEGKPVKAGDILARLDDKEAQATLNDLRASEDFQRREFDRQTQLLARGATTSQAYQRAESDLARIQAQIAAQAQRLDYYKLVAPMDGTVLKEDGDPARSGRPKGAVAGRRIRQSGPARKCQADHARRRSRVEDLSRQDRPAG
jgi:membrane fusion protein (multidrug efflux system)